MGNEYPKRDSKKNAANKHNDREKNCTSKAIVAGGTAAEIFSIMAVCPDGFSLKSTPEFQHYATIANDNSDSLCFFVLPARDGT